MQVTNEERKVIRERARQELARRNFKNYLEYVHEGRYTRTRHTDLIADALQPIADGEQRFLIVEMPPRHSKLCADSTPVYTPDGWTTHGNLKIGDYVYHPSGKAIKVLNVKPKNKADWLVTFTNGESIRVNGEHEWTVYNRSKHRYETLETQQMKDDFYTKGRCKYQLPNIKSLENKERKLPMDPYTLGVWLGDGTATKPCITYDKKDYKMIDEISDRGYEISGTHWHKDTNVPTTYFSGTRHKPGRMTKELKAIGLFNNKHIPEVYLRSSIQQRLELLAGLVDSDGHVDEKGRIRYTTTNEKIRDGVYRLVLSLGFRPYIMEYPPQSNTKWDIYGAKDVYVIGFNPTIDIPTQIERRKTKRLIKQRRISIKNIEYKPNGEIGNCITVDSDDGLYLVGNKLIPTHNSMTITETFPSYFLGKNPYKSVITTGYSETLAKEFGRLNRMKINQFGNDLFGVNISRTSGNVSDWKLDNEIGGMLSTGIGGSITGKGADCFPAGTMIDTSIGEIDIKDLHEMEQPPLILSYNHKDGSLEYKKVKATRSKTSDNFTRITTVTGNIITSTKDHRIYDIERGYKEARYFRPNNRVAIQKKKLRRGAKIKGDTVQSVENYEQLNTTVYDLQVEDNHNFFANNLLVHNCMIIDDPIKNRAEAESETYRNKIWAEWESTLSTRLQNGASVIVVQTRWHEDDFTGRLLEQSPRDWIRIRLPAIAEDENDLLGRKIGEALAPDLGYDEEWAEVQKKEVGTKAWLSLYQQRPSASEGNMFKREWWQWYDVLPSRIERHVISWDLTFKGGDDSDYVVGQLWGKRGSDYYLIDQVRGQMDFPETVKAIENFSAKYPRVREILIEDKANGSAVISTLKSKIGGIIPIKPQGSKEARAMSITPLVEAGNVYLPKGKSFISDFMEEVSNFPYAKNDKQFVV